MKLVTLLPLFIATVVLSLPLPDLFLLGTHNYPIIKSLHSDRQSAQASFIVPSLDSYGQFDTIEFTFQVSASNDSCGYSDLTLNGVVLTNPLTLSTEAEAVIPAQQDSSELPHELDVVWLSDCISVPNHSISSRNEAQLVTIVVNKVDGSDIQSLSGFTVSFTTSGQPQLLRLANHPDYTASDPSQRASWLDPPTELNIHSIFKRSPYYVSDQISSDSPDHPQDAGATNPSIPELVEELRLLEAEAEALAELIQFKHDHIHEVIHQKAEDLKKEIHQCDGWGCAIKAIWHNAQGAAEAVYLKLRPNPHRDEVRNNNTYWRVTGGQQPTVMKMSFTEDLERGTPLPQAPSILHCADGHPSAIPVDEKRPFPDELPPRPAPRNHRQPLFIVIIKTILMLTGLAYIFAFIRRRCCSLRSRTERAALREQRRTERAYRRQARRQAFRDWWHGRHRGTPGRRPGDYEEKRQLVVQQESVLEEAMQDQIQQIQVVDEIQQLRHTHTTVEQLVRAEEGRSRQLLQHDLQSTVASSSSSPFPLGFVPIPIPPRSTGDSSYRDLGLGSPRSRSSSLPEYMSESGMSGPPPSYKSRVSTTSQQGNETDDDCDIDVTSDYTPSTGGSSQYTPGSSIPDISPRPSVDTARMFL